MAKTMLTKVIKMLAPRPIPQTPRIVVMKRPIGFDTKAVRR